MKVGEQSGYIVGIPGHEQILPAPVSVGDVRTHRARVLADPDVQSDKHALQGSWNQGGEVTFDRSRLYRSNEFHDAYSTAITGQQKAIFDVRRGADIGVHEPQPGDFGRPPVKVHGTWTLTHTKPSSMSFGPTRPSTGQLGTAQVGPQFRARPNVRKK